MANKSTASDDEKSAHQQRIGEPPYEWFLKREPLVRKLVGICEDAAPPGGVIDAAWDELLSWEIDEDHRKRIPLDSQAAESTSPSEPVETRLAADGGMSVDEALQYVADHEAGKPVFMKDWMALTTFAAEVCRLREHTNQLAEQLMLSLTENNRVRQTLGREIDGRERLRIKLARVEALVKNGNVSWETVFDALQPSDEAPPEREELQVTRLQTPAGAVPANAVDVWLSKKELVKAGHYDGLTDDAIRWANGRAERRPPDDEPGPEEWLAMAVLELRDEVRRLRERNEELVDNVRRQHADFEEQLEASRAEVALMGASLKQQDAELDRIAQASDRRALKLARVEALATKWRVERYVEESDRLIAGQCLGDLEAALRDEPPPEREPKLPYNGY